MTRVRVHGRVQCHHQSCGRIAHWQSVTTGIRYCPDHAAELAAYIVVRPIEGYDTPRLDLIDEAQ